jgi:hexosaminidase
VRRRTAVVVTAVAAVTAVWVAHLVTRQEEPTMPTGFPDVVIPAPVSATTNGESYTLGAGVGVASDDAGVGDYLAARLSEATGLAINEGDGIRLRLTGAPDAVGDQGYQLVTTTSGVTIAAKTPAGLFAGVQTLLQLVPVRAPFKVPGGEVLDHPRFAYRGAMLDVARHFFTVDQVKRYIDEIATYKINYFHLHLSDDQGWRIAVNGWPKLTGIGAGTEVGGGAGGFYTSDDYRAIVAYAASRFITVVPEIDMPGHTNAALSAYPELTCDGQAPAPYTGTEVGFSTFCVDKPRVRDFIDDVFGQLAALTPGPYLHIGGDESKATPPDDYARFVEMAQSVVADHGKTVIGWHEIAAGKLLPSTVVQFWDPASGSAEVASAAAAGAKVIMSPANRAYLDMKYDSSTALGLRWAGLIDVRTAYDWDPGAFLPGVGEGAVLGVEAPLWTETITSSDDIDYMVFPRLPAIAELGWSPRSTHDVDAFARRLAAQAPHWDARGVKFFRTPEIDWPQRQP